LGINGGDYGFDDLVDKKTKLAVRNFEFFEYRYSDKKPYFDKYGYIYYSYFPCCIKTDNSRVKIADELILTIKNSIFKIQFTQFVLFVT
jgi:hypothetical protein